MIAYCGLRCDECDIYKATNSGEKELKVSVAQKFSSDDYHIGAHEIECSGCTKNSLVVFKFCNECEIRKCGISKNIETCGECSDYPCDLLSKPFEIDLTNKERLDVINIEWRRRNEY